MFTEVFKTVTDILEIKHKNKDLGAKHYELQITEQDGSAGQLLYALTPCLEHIPDIVAVHTCLTNNHKYLPLGNVDLAYIGNDIVSNTFVSACIAAQECAKRYKHPVGVVVHNSFNESSIKYLIKTNSDWAKLFEMIYNKYPDIELWIENVTPIKKVNGRYIFYGGSQDGAPAFVDYLRSLFGKNKAYMTFDLCHARTCSDMLKQITGEDTLFDLIDMCVPYTKEVHFSNVKDYGLTKDTHGIGFTDDDIDDFNLSMRMMDKFNPDTYLCYELRDKDYYNCVSLMKTVSMVRNFYKQKESL